MRLTKWQRDWVGRSFAPGVRVSAFSVARANGKTALCGWLCSESLRPGSSLFDPRTEVVIVSASMEQTRTLFGFVQDEISHAGGSAFPQIRRCGWHGVGYNPTTILRDVPVPGRPDAERAG